MRISGWSSDVCSSDLIVAGGVARVLTAWVAGDAVGLDPVTMHGAQAASLVLRPAIMLGYASALILLVASGKMRWLVARLAAAGRMALTNRSEEHTSELQSLMRISYAVFCLKKNKNKHD